MNLTENTRILTVLLFFRMIFGGYLAAMDQYRYSDPDSAITVLIIYALIAVSYSIYLYGKKIGLKAMIGIEAIFLLLNLIFTVAALGGYADVGMHSPLENVLETIIRFLFSIATLTLAFRVYRE